MLPPPKYFCSHQPPSFQGLPSMIYLSKFITDLSSLQHLFNLLLSPCKLLVSYSALVLAIQITKVGATNFSLYCFFFRSLLNMINMNAQILQGCCNISPQMRRSFSPNLQLFFTVCYLRVRWSSLLWNWDLVSLWNPWWGNLEALWKPRQTVSTRSHPSVCWMQEHCKGAVKQGFFFTKATFTLFIIFTKMPTG